MFCSECGKEVDDKSKFCGSCGNQIKSEAEKSNTENKKQTKTETNPLRKPVKWSQVKLVLKVLLVVIVFLTFYKGCQEPAQKMATRTVKEKLCIDNTGGAMYYAEKFIKPKLVSEATAKFSSAFKTKVEPIKDCSYKVEGYVDSQNLMGATLRTKYRVILDFDIKEKTWTLADIYLD